MKILNVLMLLFILPLTTLAQLKEGHIKFNVEISSDDPQMAAMIGMFNGTTFDTYFNEKNTRTEINMNGFAKTTAIASNDSKKVLTLMEIMGTKKAVLMDVDDLASDEKSKEVAKTEINVTTDTKEILGYKCTKAIMTDKDGNDLVIWFTNEIKVDKKGQKYFDEGIEGFPLEFEVLAQGMKMKFTATELDKKLDVAKDFFSMKIPEGYTEATLEEMKKMGM